jgi:hypothetical protein
MKSIFYYLTERKWRMARIYIEASMLYYRGKFIRWIDRLYLKIWPFIFTFWILTVLIWGTLQFKHDYELIHNYAHIEALSSDFYTHWNTYGSPGQDPVR